MKGKVKKLFKEWFDNTYETKKNFKFKDYPPSMQWGVLQDFYDSQGIYITSLIEPHDDNYRFSVWKMYGKYKGGFDSGYEFKTRQEARGSALEKAEKILNNK